MAEIKLTGVIIMATKKQVKIIKGKLVLFTDGKEGKKLPAFTKLKAYTPTDLINFKTLFDEPKELLDALAVIGNDNDTPKDAMVDLQILMFDTDMKKHLKSSTDMNGIPYSYIKYQHHMYLGIPHSTRYIAKNKQGKVSPTNLSNLSSGNNRSCCADNPLLQEALLHFKVQSLTPEQHKEWVAIKNSIEPLTTVTDEGIEPITPELTPEELVEIAKTV